MTPPPLHVRRLAVRRMYGASFDGLHADELCAGLNVVYGPNGAGKTTLARALQALLWPGLDGIGSAALEGRFALDEAEWYLALDGSSVRYQRDGQNSSAPPLPGSDRRDRYYLHLHELLHAEGNGDAFARAIRREAVGGVDVRQAANSLGFKQPSPRSGPSTAAVEDARKRLRGVRQGQKDLQREEQQLGELRRRRDEARVARARCEVLEHALEAYRARTEHDDARRALGTFPDVMQALRGDEVDRMEELRDALGRARAGRADAERRLAEAEEAITGNRIPEATLPDGLIDRGEEVVARIREAEQTVVRSERELTGALKRAGEAWKKVEGVANEEAASTIALEDVGQLADLVQRAGQTRAKQHAMEAMERLFGHARRPEHPDAWRDASRYLQGWLVHAQEGARLASPLARILVAVTALALTVAAVLSGLLLHPLGWALLLPAALLGYVSSVLLRSDIRTSRQDGYRRDFKRLPVDPPASWSPDAVRERLDEVFAEMAVHRVQEEKARQWEDAAAERSALEHQTERLRQQRETLAEHLGLAPDVPEEQLFYVIQHLIAWQEARRDVAVLEAEHEAARDDVQRNLDALHALIASYGFNRPDDAADAGAQVAALERAQSNLHRALDQRGAARRDLDRRGGEVTDCEKRIGALFEKLELDPGDDAALRDLCRRHEDFRKAQEVCTKAKALAEGACARLTEHPLFEDDLLNASEAELRQRLDNAETLADEESELADAISRIDERIDTARKGHDLEEARAAVQEAVAVLDDERERDYRLAAGYVLAQHLRRRTRDHDRPHVFHRAQQLFATITRGRYRLDLDDEKDTFRAYDTREERGLALDELSSGTRVQLLLAVRVAFVEQHEQGCRLPLVLDETLANSDDERAAAVVDAVLALCRTGRQVFYFTAQHDEVAKWHTATDGLDDVNCHFVPLAGAPAPEAIDASALPPGVVSPRLPAPDGLTHAEYGARLGVPSWDAYRPVGALHLWYLVEEPAVLHAALRSGIASWGQLRHLLDGGTADAAGLDAATCRRAKLLACALEAWREHWRIGRGERVDRAVLEAADAVSDNFIDEVAELCASLGGDGRQLVEALDRQEVTRWRSSKTDELRAYLLEHGYLHDAEPLPDEVVWAQTLGAVSGEMQAAGVDVDALERLFERVRVGAG